MQGDIITKWKPGGPTFGAELPGPVVRVLNNGCQTPELRLIATYHERDERPLDAQPGGWLYRRLHLDYAAGLDPLGQPYWQEVKFEARLLYHEALGQIGRALIHHLAAALQIPTAAEVEAGLDWQPLPEDLQ